MKMLPLFVMMLFVSPFAYAVDEHAGDQNIDDQSSICDIVFIESICSSITQVIDTTNSFFSDDLEAGIDESNTVKDVEKALLEADLQAAKDRTYQAWNNILSVMFIVLEAVKIFFYTFQIFILVHLPYFYVKALVAVKNMAMGMARKRGNR